MSKYSPYIKFSRDSWRAFRKGTPMTLSEEDLRYVRGQLEAVSLLEVEEIYLPLSRLLNLYVAATQELYKVTGQFLGHPEPRVPYIIGVAGSVAVGKSTTSRILRELLARWPNHLRVELVTTDGFIYPNAYLEKHELMNRKGFPESYDLRKFIQFLSDLKSGKPELQVPIYSHHDYDILPDEFQIVDRPDIVIVEGLNVLQVSPIKFEQQTRIFVSDFFDFSIYVDAETAIIKNWFLQRFMLFRNKARSDPTAFFYRFANLSDQEAEDFALQVWTEINEANLYENILPFKQRAKLILVKGADHAVHEVFLRKI
jgi:type I pantothenate kinase